MCNTERDSIEERKLIDKPLERQVDGIIVIDPTEGNFKNGYYKKLLDQIFLLVVKESSDNA